MPKDYGSFCRFNRNGFVNYMTFCTWTNWTEVNAFYMSSSAQMVSVGLKWFLVSGCPVITSMRWRSAVLSCTFRIKGVKSCRYVRGVVVMWQMPYLRGWWYFDRSWHGMSYWGPFPFDKIHECVEQELRRNRYSKFKIEKHISFSDFICWLR